MSEHIGNVWLDDTDYPGQDLYSDGDVEDELLGIAKNVRPEDFDRIVSERRSWPVMYHFSSVRQNILRWYPIRPADKVLEIGSGCGAVTGVLAEMAKSVTCVELSRKRSLVNAWRNRQHDNIRIMLGNFQDVEKKLEADYDLITLIGVFEYGSGYIASETPYEDFLRMIGKHLKKGGKILVAIENRLGMKYFAGCTEDHTGRFFDGIEGYPDTTRVRTFSKEGLARVIRDAGFPYMRFHYPYPDYKFPMSVYSDDYLPKKGELRTNMVNYDRKRMVLFDEARAYDELCGEEYPVFSNSFFVELSFEPLPKTASDYVRFSNDRAPSRAIRTDIVRAGCGPVRKMPVTPAALAHVKHMEEMTSLLEESFAGSRFAVNRCCPADGALEFEFLEGSTLEEEADRLLRTPDRHGRLFKEYFDEIDQIARDVFRAGDGFREVFGDVFPAEGCPAPAVSDIDMVLNNVIVSGDSWHVIDCEWTFPFPVPAGYIKWRTVHYYCRGNTGRDSVDAGSLIDLAGIDRRDIPCFEKMEEHFQEYISRDAMPLWKLYPYITPGIVKDAASGSSASLKADVCVYFDRGTGFTEEDVKRISTGTDGCISAGIDVRGVRSLRVDPYETACAAELSYAAVDHVPLDPETFLSNGFTSNHRSYVFCGDDPQILIPSLPDGAAEFFFRLRVIPGGEDLKIRTGEILKTKDEEIRFLKDRLAASEQTLSNVLSAVEAVKETKAVRLYRASRRKLGKSDPFLPVRPVLANHADVHLFLDKRCYQPEGIHLMGWFYDPAFRGEKLTVTDAAGTALPVTVKREIRKDVDESLGITDGRAAGFHILVPYDLLEMTPLSIRMENPRGILTLPLDIEPDPVRRREKRRLVLQGKSEDLLPVTKEYDEWRIDSGLLKDGTEDFKNLPEGEEAPLVSVVVPLYHTPPAFLEELVDSLLAQTYGMLEVCLADGSGDDSLGVFLKKRYPDEKRIRYQCLGKNLGIAGNTNAAMDMARGEIIAFADHDDMLEPSALAEIVSVWDDGTDIVYTDEDKMTVSGHFYYDPNFKPDYSPDLLRSSNYICHLFAVRKSAAVKAGPLRSGFDGAQDYDFILRCCENARKIRHIPKALYHWRAHPDSTAGNPESKTYAWESGRLAVEEHLARLGIRGTVSHTDHPGHYRVRYETEGEPKVSILIPNRDQAETLEKCVDSIREKSTWRNYEIIILENHSAEEKTWDLYRRLEKEDGRIRILTDNRPFNYAALNNRGAEEAGGEYLLFLNNDTEVIAGNWIEEMLGLCQRDDTGCVGAFLLYPDGTIQHTGVIVGMGGAAGHMFGGMDVREYPGGGRCFSTQNLSAVTGACMMTKRELFFGLNGFDESFAISYNDVDYCLKVRQKGLLVSVNVYAQLIHYESKTRGSDQASASPEKHARLMKEAALLREKWPSYFTDGDPYYNPNLTLIKPDFSLRETGES